MAGIVDSRGNAISSRDLKAGAQSEQNRMMRFADGRQEIRINSPAQLGALLRAQLNGNKSE